MPNFLTPRLLLTVTLPICVLASASLTRGDVSTLFRRVPAEANVLVVVKVQEILGTPLAVAENWAADRRTGSGKYGFQIPPAATEVVIASQLDLERNLPLWEAGIVRLDPPPSLEQVAQSLGRPVEQLAGTPAFRSPRDVYVTQFDGDVLGAMWPANYQWASHWCATVQDQRDVVLSPYLQQTVQFARSDKAHVIMSLDLTNAVPTHILRERISRSPTVSEAGLDQDAVTDLFSAVQGATLRLNISDHIAGQVRVDFGRDVNPLQGHAQQLFLEILARNGATIDEFANWEVRMEPTAVVLYGSLSPESTALILSFVQLPESDQDFTGSGKAPADPAHTTDDPTSEQARNSETAMASLEHFQKVSQSLDRLRLKRGARTMGQIAMWIDNTARQIDRLPVLHVDEDLINYSAQVSTSLRQMSMAIKGANIRSGAREAQYYGTGYYWGGYIGSGAASVSGERSRVAAEERAQGSLRAREIAQQVTQMTADIRRIMTQRYQMEF